MLLLVGVVAVLLFGERLPEVARSFGKGMMELKKGMQASRTRFAGRSTRPYRPMPRRKGHDDPYAASYRDSGTAGHEGPEEREEATSPKFEPPRASLTHR